MTHVLKNKNIEIKIDLSHENYSFPRFDWTGKIAEVYFKDKPVSGFELIEDFDETKFGKGFYNEFSKPLGFEEIEIGDWFHKIGVGLLKKEKEQYYFYKPHEAKPAEFAIIEETDKVICTCKSPNYNGFSYIFEKQIILKEGGFEVKYHLKNTGKKRIVTNEYNHNFVAIDEALMGRDYVLKFPFKIKPELFGETVNPEQKVLIGAQYLRFKDTPQKTYFFSNLSGGELVEAKWSLENAKSKIGISEKVNVQTDSINLWGTSYVISPELFVAIDIEPGDAKAWTRTYNIYEIF